MSDFSCKESNDSPKWGLLNLFIWKLVPKRLGGGIPYIQKFKDAWVGHNRNHIKFSAMSYSIPPELLAGVCWIEVGGDPEFIDRVAFEIRAFDWWGPDWVDRHLTITRNPIKTSFGAVSIQLRTAAETMGLDPRELTIEQLSQLACCLQTDIFNIHIVAQHLRQLINRDGFEKELPFLTEEQIRIVGARYNRGIGLSLEEILKNTSYGDFIVNFWPRFKKLIQ